MKLKPYLTLITGVLAVSFASIFIRFASAPPVVIATYRLLIASLVLAPFAIRRLPGDFKLSRHDFVLIALSSLFLALHFALWITSLSLTSIASSVILVTLLSFLFWHEKLSKIAIFGIVASFTGVFLVNYGDFAIGSQALAGNLMALLASFAVVGYLLIGRQMRTRIDALTYLTLVYSCSGLILLAVSLLKGYPLTGYSSFTYLMLLLLGLVPQLIGHSFINVAVWSLPATVVSVAILGEPIGATLLGIIFLRELPDPLEILGGVFIISGIYLVSRESGKRGER
jgi:drug/metabolite transporter (DMT)-like permease